MCRENGARILTARQGPSSEDMETRWWKRPCLSEGRAAGNEEVDVKREKGKREKTRKENESGKEGDIARGARMARRGRELARISTIYTHVGGTGGGGGYLVDISVFPIPGSLPSSTNPPPSSLARLPTTPGETARRVLGVVLSDRA